MVTDTLAGTWFRIQGAPGPPSVNAPADGGEVAAFTPTLTVNNAADPNELDEPVYFFEVYADAGLAQPIASGGPLAEGQGTTSFSLPVALSENTHYWWRSRAYDGYAYGAWMPTATFFVNTVNEPPGPPQADSPLEGQETDALQPILSVRNAFDPDEDALTYNFRVCADALCATVVGGTVGVLETPGITAWTVDVALADNTFYWWSAQADDWMEEGPWTAPVGFFVNTANDAPSAPTPLLPADGSETVALVTLAVANASDPDYDPLIYVFEADTDLSFSGPARIFSGSVAEGVGTTSWAIPASLAENTLYYWRVRATDDLADGPWSPVSAFFVNAVNEPPTSPVLANPSDGGESAVLQPELSVHNASDPDRDTLSYEFEVYADAGLTALVASISGLAGGADGHTAWIVNLPLSENTRYWWRCRASDGELYGPWMPAASFFVNTANDAPTAPILIAPAAGGSVDVLGPELVVARASDPDSPTLTYQFEVYADAGLTQLIRSVSGLAEGAQTVAWVVDPPLEDNRQYWWRCRAFDGERYGPWMETAGFTVHLPVQSITATINFDPDTLNLGSRGTWVTVYIELPLGYDAWSIIPSTVKLMDVIPAEVKPVSRGDCDHDGIRDLMVKFRRSAVEALLNPGERVLVRVTGTAGAMAFEGVDIIRVIRP